MPTLPTAMLHRLAPFAPCFSRRVGHHAPVLVAGAILAPGRRTVAAALRAMGLEHDRRCGRDHRVLSRAEWSGLAASRTLLGLLVAAFVPGGPLVIGVDETVGRRRGAKIAAKGISRDAVRSSHAHFVKASGRRWVCLMLLVPIPWARRVWALPFLTAPAPSERSDREHGRRHKALTDWAGRLLLVHSGDGDHAPAARCGALRASPAPSPPPEWPAPPERRAPPDVSGGRRRPGDGVA
jgi:hypothetical protein